MNLSTHTMTGPQAKEALRVIETRLRETYKMRAIDGAEDRRVMKAALNDEQMAVYMFAEEILWLIIGIGNRD